MLYDPFTPNGSRLGPFGQNKWRFWKCASKAPRAEGGSRGEETSPHFRGSADFSDESLRYVKPKWFPKTIAGLTFFPTSRDLFSTFLSTSSLYCIFGCPLTHCGTLLFPLRSILAPFWLNVVRILHLIGSVLIFCSSTLSCLSTC